MRFRALASDYDGTLAHDGRVDAATWEALAALRASGRRLLLVTGRELNELLALLPEATLFDRIVAENGAVTLSPATGAVRLLGEPPPAAFVAELRHRGVTNVAVGRVIVATWEPFGELVRRTIHDLGLALEVTLNKGAVMVLPRGVSKASGLASALAELGLAAHEVVAVGDAENDLTMLAASGLGVAVANALPSLRAAADLVTRGDHGRGVAELASRIVADELAGVVARARGADGRMNPEGRTAPDHPFVFRGPRGELALVAPDLTTFLALADRVDDATWMYHLHRGDYARWVRDQLADHALAATIIAVQAATAPDSRAAIRVAICERYRTAG
jgi:hydroxymethylpyrimidine pyrophosphatase-like HAD family hydrolase